MAPDDLPIDLPGEPPAEDSTKPAAIKDSAKPGIGPEGEVRGGAERAEDLPLEQQRRNETP